MKKVQIEVQYFNGCPHAAEMLNNVRKAIESFIDQIEYFEYLVDTNEKAKEKGFRGSPTLIINGSDYENMPENFNPSLNCRIYRNGIPDVYSISKVIEKHLLD